MATSPVCPQSPKPSPSAHGRPPLPPKTAGGTRQHLIHWPLVAGVGVIAFVLVSGVIFWLPALIGHPTATTTASETFVQPAPASAEQGDVVAVVEPPARVEEMVPEEADPASDEPAPSDEGVVEAKPHEPTPAEDAPRADEPPAPPAAAPEVNPNPSVKVFKRRDRLTAQELRDQLRRVPEVRLDGVPAIVPQLVRAQLIKRDDIHKAPTLLTQNALFAGLPLRHQENCQLDEDLARTLQDRARELHRILDQGMDAQAKANAVSQALLTSDKNQKDVWVEASAIPTLMQLLQAEDKAVRLVLVEALARIDDAAATTALARRALFDLSPKVRQAAVQSLQTRKLADSRPVLLEGFRYPWAPVADHAAEALVALGDNDAIPHLEELTKDLHPGAVFSGTDKPTVQSVRELVRVNHLSNCFMCHAPATVATNLVLGQVPVPTQPLPRLPYYGSQSRSTLIVGNFIRADVTYLKQDFSVPLPMVKPGFWPVDQRHDYVVRTRKPTVQERQALEKNADAYPQKEAVLFALRELKAENTDEVAEETPPGTAAKPIAVGDRVEAHFRQAAWRLGIVLSVRNDTYLVQYDGLGSVANEWVAKNRIRAKVWE